MANPHYGILVFQDGHKQHKINVDCILPDDKTSLPLVEEALQKLQAGKSKKRLAPGKYSVESFRNNGTPYLHHLLSFTLTVTRDGELKLALA